MGGADSLIASNWIRKLKKGKNSKMALGYGVYNSEQTWFCSGKFTVGAGKKVLDSL